MPEDDNGTYYCNNPPITTQKEIDSNKGDSTCLDVAKTPPVTKPLKASIMPALEHQWGISNYKEYCFTERTARTSLVSLQGDRTVSWKELRPELALPTSPSKPPMKPIQKGEISSILQTGHALLAGLSLPLASTSNSTSASQSDGLQKTAQESKVDSGHTTPANESKTRVNKADHGVLSSSSSSSLLSSLKLSQKSSFSEYDKTSGTRKSSSLIRTKTLSRDVVKAFALEVQAQKKRMLSGEKLRFSMSLPPGLSLEAHCGNIKANPNVNTNNNGSSSPRGGTFIPHLVLLFTRRKHPLGLRLQIWAQRHQMECPRRFGIIPL